MIFLRREWTSQPPAGVSLSAFARSLGVHDALLPHGADGKLQSVTGMLTPDGGSGTRAGAIGPAGRARRLNGGADFFRDGGRNDPRGGYFWLLVASVENIPQFYGGLFARTTDNSTGGSLVFYRQDGTTELRVDHQGSYSAIVSNITQYFSPTPAVWIARWTPATGRAELYRNGVRIGISGVVGAPGYIAGQGRLHPLSNRDIYSSVGNVYLSAFGNRCPTDAQVAALSARPWRLFAPHPLWVPASAGGAFSLNAESGNYTITGAAASTNYNRVLSADSGAYNITGVAATFVYTPNAGAYTLIADPGAYAITGSAATLSVARMLDAGPGAYGINGVAASLVYTPNATYSLNAASGSYSIAGAAATLQRNRAIDAQPGAYGITGASATLYWSGQVQPATQTRVASPQLNAGQPAVYPHDGTMQQHFRQWVNIVTQYLPIVGNGSPEGVVAAPMYSLYIDSTGTTGSIEYRKMLPDIAGDRKMGWVKT